MRIIRRPMPREWDHPTSEGLSTAKITRGKLKYREVSAETETSSITNNEAKRGSKKLIGEQLRMLPQIVNRPGKVTVPS